MPAFLWQMQIQAIEFGLNDKIQIQPKKNRKKDPLLIYTLWYEFSNNFYA